jgi:hypothetical protein
MNRQSTHLKRIAISPSSILHLMQGGTFHISHNEVLPKDVKVVNVYLSPESNCFMMIIESKEFPVVTEGTIIPLIEDNIIIQQEPY